MHSMILSDTTRILSEYCATTGTVRQRQAKEIERKRRRNRTNHTNLTNRTTTNHPDDHSTMRDDIQHGKIVHRQTLSSLHLGDGPCHNR
jgi:hypothetical protein